MTSKTIHKCEYANADIEWDPDEKKWLLATGGRTNYGEWEHYCSFYITHCPFCGIELQDMDELQAEEDYSKMSKGEVVAILIATDKHHKKMREILNEYNDIVMKLVAHSDEASSRVEEFITKVEDIW